MKIHVDNHKGKSSQSVANAITQRHVNNNEVFQFKDNRKQYPVQTKLQSNGSDVFQLKKLVPGTLNVVGEHHSESTARRDQEIELAQREVGGGYWTEDNFRIRRTKPFETYKEDSEDDPRVFGDALYLRIAESIQYTEEAKTDFIREWKKWTVVKLTTKNLKDLKEELQGILVTCKTHIKEAERLANLYLKNEEVRTLPVEVTTIIEKMNELLPKTVATFLSLAEVWKSLPLEELIAFRFLYIFEPFSYNVNELSIYARQLAGASLDETSKLRSYEMDNAATFAHNRVGVWKIGYHHVADIKAALAEEGITNYELIDRDEFNSEYKELPIWVDGELKNQE
ncbi:hypothetical protein [Tenacibaculum agarivorans]|uniref:hypothetical protein n=1 Tax=Tenacibaculum agarivorans TaxID=1908389 RepID=UPI00094B7B5D|nr:hypothetical protein [Tenacibaculum agarivorans]